MASTKKIAATVAMATIAAGAASVAHGAIDFGQKVQGQLSKSSVSLFGIGAPLAASSTASIDQATALADPKKLITLAKGLTVKVITANGPAWLDQAALWPTDSAPTHLIVCNEQSTTDPGLVRINIATGQVDTIVAGTSECDGVRRTAWGTILFSEEAGGGVTGGAAYELINPLDTTGVSLDRTTGTFTGGTGAANLVARKNLGRMSFEGHALLDSGVLYQGDENRPGTGNPGGAIFKYIPASPRFAPGTITTLADSPLAAGAIFGFRAGRRSGSTDYGQGNQYGKGTWVAVCGGSSGVDCTNADLRALTVTLKLTGYYRPEDMDLDRVALAAGNVRFCGPNTGNEVDDELFGEVVCFTDGLAGTAMTNTAIPQAEPFVIGGNGLRMPDNIAFQPGRNNWIVHEDADTTYLVPHNNDIFSCMPDGLDEDLLTDGCVRFATLNDLTAETTGGIFTADGKRFFVSIQHNISGKGVILEIDGWK